MKQKKHAPMKAENYRKYKEIWKYASYVNNAQSLTANEAYGAPDRRYDRDEW